MSREEAIRELEKIRPKCCKWVNDRLKGGFPDHDSPAGQAIDMAIAALQEPGWTPCSEGLPESDEIVLLQFTPGESFMRTGFIIGKYWYNSGLTQYGSLDDVIAWRPLPEPYKEG